MKLIWDAGGIQSDDWLREYLVTTVTFAIWQPGLQIDCLRARLDHVEHEKGASYVRCALRVEIPGQGHLSSGATGADVYEAIQAAADLLEVALYRPLKERRAPIPGDLDLAA